MTNGDKPSGNKGKGRLESIEDQMRSGFNTGKFLFEGKFQRKLRPKEVEEAKKILEAKRRNFYQFNTSSDKAGLSSSTTTRTGPEAIRSLTGEEKAQLYELKHSMKEMLKLNPNMDPPEGDPYVPKDLLSNAHAIRQEASAYIETGIIDRDFTEYLEKLYEFHSYLTRCLKPGAALKELMKLPDDPTAYPAQETQHLLDSFGAQFTEAAQIVRKIPQAMQLVDEAAKAGVVFGGYAEEGPIQLIHAYYQPDTHAVYIPKAVTDPVIAAQNFWFELTNSKNKSKLIEFDSQARAGTITKEEYASRKSKIEEEAVLKLGEIWSQTKGACENPTELDGYDSSFYLRAYQAHQEGTDEILNILIESAMVQGKTYSQYHGEQFDQFLEEGAPFRELMELPDDETVYSAHQTQDFMARFRDHSAEAAKIVRKIPQAMQLVDEAAKVGVVFGGYAEEGPGPLSHASYVPDTHAVYIPKDWNDPVAVAGSLWFPLASGKNKSTYTELATQVHTIEKEEYINRMLEIQEKAVLKTGEIWFQVKRACNNSTELDRYDGMFYLPAYQDHLKGNDDTLKTVIETSRQIYGEQFDQLRNQATQP